MYKRGQRSKVKGEGLKVKGQWKRMTFYLLPFTFYLVLFPYIGIAETIDRIAAVVDGDIITLSEVDEAMAHFQKGNKTENLRREVTDKLIDEILLNHAIEKAKITVEDEELTRAVQNVLRQNKMTPEQLRADLASKGVSYETYMHQLANQIRFIKFTNQVIGQQVKLTDRELRDYYERNKERFGSEPFESVKEKIYDVLYDERLEEALHNYLQRERQRAYIDVRL